MCTLEHNIVFRWDIARFRRRFSSILPQWFLGPLKCLLVHSPTSLFASEGFLSPGMGLNQVVTVELIGPG